MQPSFFQIWRLRLTYLILVTGILMIQVIPLETAPRLLAAPDLILVLTICWSFRRPDVMTPLLFGGALLFSDFLLHRPPGLWPLVVTIIIVIVVNRARDLEGSLFLREWTIASFAITVCFATYQFALLISFIPNYPLWPSMLQWILTVLSYPVVVTLSARFFNIRWAKVDSSASGGSL